MMFVFLPLECYSSRQMNSLLAHISRFQGDAAKMEPMVGVGKRLAEMLLKKRETVRIKAFM